MPLLATDTYYYSDHALCAIVCFEWNDPIPGQVFTTRVENVAPYQPGQFYKRELPCILQCLKQIDLAPIEAIVVDGHVYVDNHGAPGLGAHLYEALQQRTPVIGVAKTSFAKNKDTTKNILRGSSTKPLYVSAIGTALDDAAERIKRMHGDYRMPSILKELDQLSRS